ncbi:MAG: tyrosine-type recombinase/integrase [Pseudomonadota bacterium]
MPKATLTDLSIRALAPPEKGQVTHWDRNLKGFGVRVSPGGTKTFVVVHGVNRQRSTIGRYPTLKLADARKAAKDFLHERARGKHNPVSVTYSEALSLFLDAARQKNRPRTVRDYTRLLNRHFRFGKLKLHDITKQEVMRRVNKLKNTPAEQNHAFVAARVFFNWAIRNGYLTQSPLHMVQLPAVLTSRDRVLNDDELKAVYLHAEQFPSPYGHIVRLLILTGQRRGEIGALQWDWIDDGKITLPEDATKNGRTHTFPLGAMAQAVIDDIPRIHDTYVFPAARSHIRGKATTHFNGWAKCKPAFDKDLDIAPYVLHDLRRTFASNLAKLGTPIHVTERLLNHVSGTVSGVAAIYNRHSYLPEMETAIGMYEQFIRSISGPVPH